MTMTMTIDLTEQQEAMARLTTLGDIATPFAIRAVSELGVSDALADGPLHVDDIAAKVGAHAPSLNRVLRALACQGVYREVTPLVYELTMVADLLRSDHPTTMKDAFQMMVPDAQAWARFETSVRTDTNAFEEVHGEKYWDYVDQNDHYRDQFERTIGCMTEHEIRAVHDAYDFGTINHLVDVGGGTGQMLAGLIGPHPQTSATLFDLPHVAPLSLPYLQAQGVADRVEIVSGDFFVSVPGGGDAYLLKRVLYDWTDDEARAILTNVRDAMEPGARVLAMDAIIRPDNRFDVGKIHDVLVLALGWGRARTAKEMRSLMADVGLKVTRTIPTPVFPVLEARQA